MRTTVKNEKKNDNRRGSTGKTVFGSRYSARKLFASKLSAQKDESKLKQRSSAKFETDKD
jgi:hypothetical protein